MVSAELKELLTKYSNQIDKEHIDLFLKLINELRIYICVNQLFICVNNIIQRFYSENIYSPSFNICRCQKEIYYLLNIYIYIYMVNKYFYC